MPPLFSSPVLSHFILYSLPSSATVVLLSRSNPISVSTLSPPVSLLFYSPVLITFHSLLSSPQCHCCSPLPFYPISFSTLSPPVPLLFSSPVLSHFILYSLPSSATVVLLSRSNPISFSTLFPPVPLFSSPVLSHFILYSLRSSATALFSSPVLIPFHFLLSSLQCHSCSPLPFYPISLSTLFAPVPPLFYSPVLITFHSLLSSPSAIVVLLSRSIPFHSLLSPLQCHCCSPLPLYPISFSTLFPPAPLLFSSPVLSHCILYSLPLQCHCCSPIPF